MSQTTENTGVLARSWLLLLGAVIIAAGLFFTIGGGKLVLLGGSPYFVLAGRAS
jgi:quinate dehydrogenase (quinone)